jgi:hypothetical protein
MVVYIPSVTFPFREENGVNVSHVRLLHLHFSNLADALIQSNLQEQLELSALLGDSGPITLHSRHKCLKLDPLHTGLDQKKKKNCRGRFSSALFEPIR